MIEAAANEMTEERSALFIASLDLQGCYQRQLPMAVQAHGLAPHNLLARSRNWFVKSVGQLYIDFER